MAEKQGTGIQWTHLPGYRGETWNPSVGCSVVTPGCTNCYAQRMAARLEAMGSAKYAGITHKTRGGAVWNGVVRLDEGALDIPLRHKSPRCYFVNSMSDLFHESLPDSAIDRVFSVMQRARHHIFQVLTKRDDRMREYVSRFRPSIPLDGYLTRDGLASVESPRGSPMFSPDRWPLPNVWLGVSVEDQKRADERIYALLRTPAAVRFLSCEPLLGPINLDLYLPLPSMAPASANADASIDWVIAGAESGPGARPCSVSWIRAIRDQCAEAGVPFYYKQFATRAGKKIPTPVLDGRRWTEFPTTTEANHGR
jgi:protein gp37